MNTGKWESPHDNCHNTAIAHWSQHSPVSILSCRCGKIWAVRWLSGYLTMWIWEIALYICTCLFVQHMAKAQLRRSRADLTDATCEKFSHLQTAELQNRSNNDMAWQLQSLPGTQWTSSLHVAGSSFWYPAETIGLCMKDKSVLVKVCELDWRRSSRSMRHKHALVLQEGQEGRALTLSTVDCQANMLTRSGDMCLMQTLVAILRLQDSSFTSPMSLLRGCIAISRWLSHELAQIYIVNHSGKRKWCQQSDEACLV